MSSSPQSNPFIPSVGALLKSAWLIIKTRFGVLVAIEAIPVLLGFIYGFVAEIVSRFVQPTGLVRIILTILAVLAVITIMVVMLWSYAALFHAIHGHKERLGMKAAYQHGWKQLPAFVWLNLLIGLVAFGATIPLIIPGIILGVWFSFALWVLVDAKRRGSEAVWVSREYVRGAWWAVWGRVLFLTLLGLIIVAVLYIPILVIAGQSTTVQNILQFVNLIFSIVWGLLTLAYMYCIYQALKERKGTAQVAVASRKRVGIVLLAIWGILAMVIVVVGVLLVANKGLSAARTQARYAKVDTDLRYLQSALELYRKDKGEYPQYLKDLTRAGLVTVMPKDPATGQPYKYTPSLEGTEYELCGSTGRTPEQGHICYTSPGLQPTPDPITDPQVYLPLLQQSDNDKVTLQGPLEETKLGAWVQGVLLPSLTTEEIEKYKGKLVRVRGRTLYTLPTHCSEDPALYACTEESDTPALRDIESLEIVSE